MGTKKRGTGRPRLTVIQGDGMMKSVRTPRRQLPTGVNGLPTRIYFSRGSSTPTGGSLATLHSYAGWLTRNRVRRIFVVGHANRRLRNKAAISLADARARAVRDLLVWLGAKRDQVRRVTPSRLHRLWPDSTRGQRAAHRFVELVVAPTGSLLAQRAVPPRRTPARMAAYG